MGYRSEVGIVMTEYAVKKFREAIGKIEDKALEEKIVEMLYCAEHHFVDKESGAEFYYWPHVKWYDASSFGYPEMQFVSKFFDTLDDDNKQEEYFYIRLGEDFEDTEYRGEYWSNPFDMYINHCIHFVNINKE